MRRVLCFPRRAMGVQSCTNEYRGRGQEFFLVGPSRCSLPCHRRCRRCHPQNHFHMTLSYASLPHHITHLLQCPHRPDSCNTVVHFIVCWVQFYRVHTSISLSRSQRSTRILEPGRGSSAVLSSSSRFRLLESLGVSSGLGVYRSE